MLSQATLIAAIRFASSHKPKSDLFWHQLMQQISFSSVLITIASFSSRLEPDGRRAHGSASAQDLALVAQVVEADRSRLQINHNTPYSTLRRQCRKR